MTKTARLIRVAFLMFLLSMICTVCAAAASLGAGTVTASALRLRAEPSTDSSILATAGEGSRLVVLEEAGDGWYKVDYKTIAGYMHADYLDITTTTDADFGYGYVDTGSTTLNLRSGASISHEKLASIPGESIVPVLGISDGWYKVTYGGKTGFVSSDYVVLVNDHGSRADGTHVTRSVSSNSLGEQIVALTKQFLGCPYVYGGNGPKKFDCSGFTKYIYAQFGYTLNRTATNQLSNGVSVSRSQLQPGDLVFFKYKTSKPVSHVGIYIGGGQFIHASSTQYKVCISDMSSGHYSDVYVYGRRIL